MLKAALTLFARLLPFAAAMMASVAIGASTAAPAGTPDSPQDAPSQGGTLRSTGSAQLAGPRSTALSSDTPLVARAATSDALSSTYPVDSFDTALTTLPRTVVSREPADSFFHLPRPDRWTALFSTLALVAFFFLRRIV